MAKLKSQIKRIYKNQKGFTLIEMLLVLSITMIICMIGINVCKKQFDRQLEDRFIQELKTDIELTQALSYEYKSSTYLYVPKELSEIRIYVSKINKEKPIIVRQYSKKIRYHHTGNINVVQFSENHTVAKAGTMVFSVNGRLTKLIVYLGEGRVKIVQ
ncbi:competence type IV pilus minor pilin ComGD [Rummeliibacillus sp. JY-2-4R]